MRSNDFVTTLLLAMGLCLIAPSALIGTNPLVVQPTAPAHKFLDGTNVAIQSISAIMMAADIVTTNRAREVPGTRELNPLTQSPAARYGLKFAAFGAGLGISYLMHRSGHHKMERIVPVFFGIPSGVAAADNVGIHR